MQVIKLMAQEMSNVSREMHDNKSLVDALLCSLGIYMLSLESFQFP